MQLYTKILIGMLVGAALGALVGPNSALLPHDGLEIGGTVEVLSAPDADADAVPEAAATRTFRLVGDARVGDQAGYEVAWALSASDIVRLRAAGTLADAAAGERMRGWVVSDPVATRSFSRFGASVVTWTEWIGRVFLNLIKMVVVPLVFLSLLVGVASLGDLRKLSTLGGRTVRFFLGTTVCALTIGVGLASLVRPGHVVPESSRDALMSTYADGASGVASNAAAAPSLSDQIVSIIPTNPARALADGNMLQIIFIALILGIALTMMDTRRAKPVVEMADRLNDAMVIIVMMAMELAPYGVAALLFKVVGTTGIGVLAALGVYAGVVAVGLLLHVILTYGAVLRFRVGVGLLPFVRAMRPALLVAFSTSSSSATLPVTKQCAEDNLGVSRPVSSFVLPLGATINMDGTGLYQGVAALFIAQIYALDLTLGDQVTIVLTATLASIGAAGVPGAGMVTLAMVLASVGVPIEGIALIIGVDRILDMLRTTTNVIGDATAAAYVATCQGEKLRVRTPAEDAADPSSGLEGRHLDDHPIALGDDG